MVFELQFAISVMGMTSFAVSHTFAFRPTLMEVEAKVWEFVDGHPDVRKALANVAGPEIARRRICVKGKWYTLSLGSQLQDGCAVSFSIVDNVNDKLVAEKKSASSEAQLDTVVRSNAVDASRMWLLLKSEQINMQDPPVQPRLGIPSSDSHLARNLPRYLRGPVLSVAVASLDGISFGCSKHGDIRVSAVSKPATSYAGLNVGLKLLAVNGLPVYSVSQLAESARTGPIELLFEAPVVERVEQQLKQQREEAEQRRNERRKLLLSSQKPPVSVPVPSAEHPPDEAASTEAAPQDPKQPEPETEPAVPGRGESDAPPPDQAS